MAKKTSFAALALAVISLFFPWFVAGSGDASVTAGPLGGTLSEPALLVFASCTLLAALLGSLLGLKRFGRGLGIAVMVFAVLGAGLWFLTHSALGERGASGGMGLWLLLGGVLATLSAGVIGIARPEPAA